MISSSGLTEIQFNKQDIDLNSYPFSLPFFKNCNGFRLHPKVTFFLGENGAGKSTLLEAIAIALGFNPEGGSINFNFTTRASHSVLHKYIIAAKGIHRYKDGFFLRSESFYNVASEIDNLDANESYGYRSLHEQSHGESFWATFTHRFRGNGLYILDEPEAALSPATQMAVLVRLKDLIQSNSQFIIATHSPILAAYPDALIYEFDDKGMHLQNYSETQLFQSYQQFFQNPTRVVSRLLHL